MPTLCSSENTPRKISASSTLITISRDDISRIYQYWLNVTRAKLENPTGHIMLYFENLRANTDIYWRDTMQMEESQTSRHQYRRQLMPRFSSYK